MYSKIESEFDGGIEVKNISKFILMWFIMIVSAVFMPILTLLHIEVKMKVTRK